MDFNDFQRRALETDQVPGTDGDALVVPLLGMAGEVGDLLTEYKKRLRDKDAHRLFRDRVAEELGDVLWYVSNLASKFDLSLDQIADLNLQKINDRWAAPRELGRFDSTYKESERLPDSFDAEIIEDATGDVPRIILILDGKRAGAIVRDNSYEDDGYRFHDVLHLGHAGLLGWSPNIRSFLRRKRRSAPRVDEVEDGGRAGVIEEGIAAFVFNYARTRDFLRDVPAIDYSVLRTINEMTAGLEVSTRSSAEWQAAILRSYAVWREVRDHRGGRLRVDIAAGSLTFEGEPTMTFGAAEALESWKDQPAES